MYLFHWSIHIVKAAAVMVLVTPTHSFLKGLPVNQQPASSFLSWGNKKKAAVARSGESGGGGGEKEALDTFGGKPVVPNSR